VEGDAASFARLQWSKVEAWREWRLSEGCYILRSNVTDWSPEELCRIYIQLTEAEEAFHIHKSDLAIHPVWHQKEHRVQAHILVCFLTLRALGKPRPRVAAKQGGRRAAASLRRPIGDRAGGRGASEASRNSAKTSGRSGRVAPQFGGCQTPRPEPKVSSVTPTSFSSFPELASLRRSPCEH